MAENTCMQQDANDNRGMGMREMCDERIIVASSFPTHITFRTGVLSVTITLSPQK